MHPYSLLTSSAWPLRLSVPVSVKNPCSTGSPQNLPWPYSPFSHAEVSSHTHLPTPTYHMWWSSTDHFGDTSHMSSHTVTSPAPPLLCIEELRQSRSAPRTRTTRSRCALTLGTVGVTQASGDRASGDPASHPIKGTTWIHSMAFIQHPLNR